MFAKILLPFLTLKVALTLAQINGEFWWLNDKITQLKGVEPPPVKLEEVSEFETDETDKVVFTDADKHSTDVNINKFNNKARAINTDENWKLDFNFHDESKVIFPDELKKATNYTKANYANKPADKNKSIREDKDVLNFVFPEDNRIIWKEISGMSKPSKLAQLKNDSNKNHEIKKPHKDTNRFNRIEQLNGKIVFKSPKEEIHNPSSKNLCTYTSESDCNQKNGFIYLSHKKSTLNKNLNPDLICCVLPLPPLSKTHSLESKRYKRSLNMDGIVSPAQKQRNALILLNLASQSRPIKTNLTSTTQRTIRKIVTPDDDYIDPYWNIKNPKTPYTHTNPYQSTNVNFNGDDYVEDYVVELPKPGLVGLYSDQDRNPGSTSGWTFIGNPRPSYDFHDDVDFEDDPGNSFGYSTINPRLQNRVRPMTSKTPKRGKPMKLSVDLPKDTYDPESYTITYQSNPDFQVLQGFKLLNLVRNKNKIQVANERKITTTESIIDNDYSEALLGETDSEQEYDAFVKEDRQVYKECGNAAKNPLDVKKGRRAGQAEKGSHSWLALVVLTKKQQSILCYATIVHPRGAVTAADCVYGRTSSGEITLIAGLWNLEDTRDLQKRMITVRIHPDYKRGELADDLAILHWEHPLRLGATVQPACLAEPHVGDDCIFIGWGGYDQEIRVRSQWQKASILTPRQCDQRLYDVGRPDDASGQMILPNNAFCATVDTRRSVTGIGGPLLCSNNRGTSVVGVAVWHDNAVVLISARNWVIQEFDSLDIN